jgi:hypothetical protein
VVKVCLLTKDNSLKKELSSVMPKGFKVVKGLSGDGGSFILFEPDTIRASFIAKHSESLRGLETVLVRSRFPLSSLTPRTHRCGVK